MRWTANAVRGAIKMGSFTKRITPKISCMRRFLSINFIALICLL